MGELLREAQNSLMKNSPDSDRGKKEKKAAYTEVYWNTTSRVAQNYTGNSNGIRWKPKIGQKQRDAYHSEMMMRRHYSGSA